MKKTICESKLNAYVAFTKAVKVINNYAKKEDVGDVIDRQVHLRKIVLKTSAFSKTDKRNPTDTPAPQHSKPFYAFVLQAGTQKVIVPLETGFAKVYDNSEVVSETKVPKMFYIHGVAYGRKDSVNGFVRYAPVRIKKKERRKLSVNGPLVTAALREQEV